MQKEDLKIKTIDKMMKKPNELLNGIFTIGYDISENKDRCCLIVAQPRGTTEVMIINEFYDEEANEIYLKLMGD